MQETTRHLAVRGVELAWEEHGGGTRPLVLVHGFTGSRADWADVVPSLASFGRTLVYDQRGHGRSSKPRQAAAYSVTELVDDLEAFLSELGVDSCDLIGHSFGGAVVMNYALRHPARAASLVLVDTAADVPAELCLELATMADIVAACGMQPLIDQLDHDDPQREQLSQVEPIAFASLARSMLDQPPLSGSLSEIACPTTVIVGGDDAAFLEPAAALVAAISGAELATIAGADHSPQRSKPQAWLAVVLRHLQGARRLTTA